MRLSMLRSIGSTVRDCDGMSRGGFSRAAFLLVLALLLSTHVLAWAKERALEPVDWKTRPLLKREGPNLLPNPSVNGPAGYEVPGDTAYRVTGSDRRVTGS